MPQDFEEESVLSDELRAARSGRFQRQVRPPARPKTRPPVKPKTRPAVRLKGRPYNFGWGRSHPRGCNCPICTPVANLYDMVDASGRTTLGAEYIRWVQSTLNQLMDLRLPVDGVMGADTRGAIRSFQRREGLPEDGIVGPPTEAALMRAIRSQPSQDRGGVHGNSEEGEISRNTKDYVRWVQRTLNQALGIRLTEDGSIGPATRSAIRNFQKQKRLHPDGSVGPRTERALLAAAASPFLNASKSVSEPRQPSTPFQLTAVESPGGGRIRDKTPVREADLVTVTGAGGKPILLHRLTAQAWQAMLNAARADGIKAPILLPTSGYRSPARQKQLWQEALKKHGSAGEARKWVAPPGGSPHQTGRAIDLHLGGRNTSGNVVQLRTLPAFKWLVGNARRFGFFPYEREPWHWEYNPPAR